MLPNSIQKFVKVMSYLPSIGPRQAMRLAFHLISLGKNKVDELTNAIDGLKNINRCPECFFVYEMRTSGVHGDTRCPICSNVNRQQNVIAILEKETDLLSLEKTKKFSGRYFIVGNLKKSGLPETEQKLRLNSLKKRLENKNAEEIILAINPTAYGDAGALWLKGELKNCAKKITRLGRGIPTGGEIEFADEDTLGGALDNRN